MRTISYNLTLKHIYEQNRKNCLFFIYMTLFVLLDKHISCNFGVLLRDFPLLRLLLHHIYFCKLFTILSICTKAIFDFLHYVRYFAYFIISSQKRKKTLQKNKIGIDCCVKMHIKLQLMHNFAINLFLCNFVSCVQHML